MPSASTNPLLRGRNPFEKRLVEEMGRSRPGQGIRSFRKPLPGGVSIENPRAVSKVAPANTPFTVTGKGKVLPGLVGGVMPTLSGVALDDAAVGVIDLTSFSGNFKVYFKMTFSVTYLSTFLSAYTLSSVTVEKGTSIPSNTDSIKYLQFNTITSGKPRSSFFSTSISVSLYDNGANATGLHYATA